ncbi:hypothetical protein BDI01nite_00700 [Brevundimonas diminuta]|nr:hypothetical protein BDI01nite_00700 [Brevundimonas diminuta]
MATADVGLGKAATLTVYTTGSAAWASPQALRVNKSRPNQGRAPLGEPIDAAPRSGKGRGALRRRFSAAVPPR